MEVDWTTGKLAEGLRHYDAGQFFAAHESWECVWLLLLGAEKTFLQGVIQVAAAFHHLQNRNRQGAVQLLRAGLRRIESCSTAEFAGISVTLLCSDIGECLEMLEAGNTIAELVPPRIRPQ